MLKINKTELQQVYKLVNQPLLSIKDLRPAWLVIRNDLRNVVWKQQFETEGGYAGSGWEPLSDKYAAWKEKHYPGKPILQLTGQLKKSFTEDFRGSNGGYYQLLAPSFMEVGSDLKVGKYNLGLLHQTGTENMPARKVVELTSREHKLYPEIIVEYIYKSMDKG